MPEPSNKFSRRSNDNLLQLWKGRDRLSDYDIDPLRDELERRGLSKEVEEISQQASVGGIYGELPTGPQTWLNLTVPFWWLRELWLRYKTRNGLPIDATVESTKRTGSRYRMAARAELRYSYEFQGRSYLGRAVRDFTLGSAPADSLAYDHHPGEKVPVVINQNEPEISYFPSGFGSIAPIIVGVQSLLSWAIVIGLLRLVLLSIMH